MSVSLTFHFESLQEANDFLAATGPPALAENRSPTVQRDEAAIETAAQDVEKWWRHLGEKSREFWVIAARHMQENESFTFEELATDEISQGSLKSRHRNSYRAIKSENATEPLDSEWSWEIGKNIYVLTPTVRDRILELSGEAEN